MGAAGGAGAGAGAAGGGDFLGSLFGNGASQLASLGQMGQGMQSGISQPAPSLSAMGSTSWGQPSNQPFAAANTNSAMGYNMAGSQTPLQSMGNQAQLWNQYMTMLNSFRR